ncbi:MAG: hypothetical protein I3274_02775 [Candidatus Moeniiplasma glomeromycotorum]|nr:hypothetical protein [Candidatus Moeniiplasma glomeromycotorum]MCE8167529.1 hypothetical protein [Candidatus Moeniiplasma glomeromycotorum]
MTYNLQNFLKWLSDKPDKKAIIESNQSWNSMKEALFPTLINQITQNPNLKEKPFYAVIIDWKKEVDGEQKPPKSHEKTFAKSSLQKELQEKLKEGIKPSQLKRSKSASDIPNPPPEPLNDPKYPYTSLISQQEKIAELEKETQTKSSTIKLLRDKIEQLEVSPPNSLLADQLKAKQKEIESLRERIEELQQQLETTKELSELDEALFARHKNLGDWFKEYSKRKELDQDIDEASEEIIELDEKIDKLRRENFQLKHHNQTLQRDLNSAERLAELRKNNVPYVRKNFESDVVPDFLRPLIYFVLLLTLTWLSFKNKNKDHERNP